MQDKINQGCICGPMQDLPNRKVHPVLEYHSLKERKTTAFAQQKQSVLKINAFFCRNSKRRPKWQEDYILEKQPDAFAE